MNNKKYKCRKCGKVFGGEEVDFQFEGSEVGKLPDGTSIVSPTIHKDCGGAIDEVEPGSDSQ